MDQEVDHLHIHRHRRHLLRAHRHQILDTAGEHQEVKTIEDRGVKVSESWKNAEEEVGHSHEKEVAKVMTEEISLSRETGSKGEKGTGVRAATKEEKADLNQGKPHKAGRETKS